MQISPTLMVQPRNLAKIEAPKFGGKSRSLEKMLQDALKEGRLGFFDVDTQVDFMLPPRHPRKGLFVPGAPRLLNNLKDLTDLAYELRIPMFATLDTHTKTDSKSRAHFEVFKAISDSHCLKGTPGHAKVTETTVPHTKPWLVSLKRGKKDVPSKSFLSRLVSLGRQIFIEKNDFSGFDNPKTLRTLKNSKVDTVVVYGVATDYCVEANVKDLKAHGYNVIVVRDAIKEIAENKVGDACHAVYGDVKTITTKHLARILRAAQPAQAPQPVRFGSSQLLFSRFG